jgi:hypothetical protein
MTMSLEERPMLLLGEETPGERGAAIDLWRPVVTAAMPEYWPVAGLAIASVPGWTVPAAEV